MTDAALWNGEIRPPTAEISSSRRTNGVNCWMSLLTQAVLSNDFWVRRSLFADKSGIVYGFKMTRVRKLRPFQKYAGELKRSLKCAQKAKRLRLVRRLHF